jgi:hypothetical protein
MQIAVLFAFQAIGRLKWPLERDTVSVILSECHKSEVAPIVFTTLAFRGWARYVGVARLPEVPIDKQTQLPVGGSQCHLLVQPQTLRTGAFCTS